MSLIGPPARPLLPLPQPTGTLLALVRDLPAPVQQMTRLLSDTIQGRLADVQRIVDIAFNQVVGSASGFTLMTSLSGSTVPARNLGKVAIDLSGGTQFVWQFRATEQDANYGILLALNGPFTPPTTIKARGGVTFEFGDVTPAGLTGDVLLFR
jgi:hypothetical protein